MKYVTSEKMKNAIITMYKARYDIENTAKRMGFKRIEIPTVFSIRYKKWQKPIQAYLYWKNSRIWDKTFKNMEDGSDVIIQINLFNRCLNFYKIIEKHKNRLNFITLIHDLESIRFIGDKTKSEGYMERTHRDEIGILIHSNKVISHNEAMTKELVRLGVDREKIINLEIFDYLNDENKKAKAHYGGSIIIAGNLAPDKAGYLNDLKNIKDVDFNLYGFNYTEEYDGKNVHYKGNFSPEELVESLDGGFGLIWDGDSIRTCSGFTGQYLKYNNPHKTSLYLSSGLPVIIWEKAALAQFIVDNKLGFSVKTIEEIPKKLKKISEKDYKEMTKNVKIIAKKLKTGKFTEEALKKAEK